jgi:broad specificity phosphatase PhoE
MTESINSILVSHNARLRCVITKLFNKSLISADDEKRRQFKEFRWQNCCVLKLSLVPNAGKINFNLSLIYAGEIDPMETKAYAYWSDRNYSEELEPKAKSCIGSLCSNKTTVSSRIFYIFEPLIGIISLSDLSDIPTNNQLNTNTKFTFYLVRHGQAQHNITGSHNVIDTSLTNIGRSGAKNAGIALNNELTQNNSILRYYFASDLIRTRQTLQGILSGVETSRLYLETRAKKINLLILPCAHELPFVSNGNCDSSTNIKVNISQLGSEENKMSCNKLNNYSSTTPQYITCVSFNCITSDNVTLLVNLDWSIYAQFYDKSYRGDRMKTFFSSKKQCRQTSMIEESMKYIIQPNKVTVGGRKSRKGRSNLRKKSRKNRRK